MKCNPEVITHEVYESPVSETLHTAAQRSLIVATDADTAGDKAYTAIRKGLPGVEILRVRPPDGHDINERYVSDPEALIHALNGTAATVTG